MKLVIGGHGFLGRHLVRHLKQKQIEVIVPTRKELDIVEPIRKIDRVNHIFHLAAKRSVSESWDSIQEYHSVNVHGTLNVLEYCRDNQCSMTYISAFVYGITDEMPIKESLQPSPSNPYALTKFMGEQLCEFYAKVLNVPITILRIFNVYGPGQGPDFLIPKIIQQFLDKSIKEVVVTDLDPRRDFIYVDDVVQAILDTSEKPEKWGVYNVGSGESHSVEDLLKVLQKLYHHNKPYKSSENLRKNEIPEVIADISRIREDFGWEPTVSLQDGLTKTIDSLNL
jgi:nucleoside-diphosphate-sugar epimerase